MVTLNHAISYAIAMGDIIKQACVPVPLLVFEVEPSKG